MCEGIEIARTHIEEWCLELHVTHDNPLKLGSTECERMQRYKEYLFLAYISKMGMDKTSRAKYEEAWAKHLIVVSRYDEHKKNYKECVVLHIKTNQTREKLVI